MPAHLGILHSPPLCNNLRITTIFCFWSDAAVADGAARNKNIEAFPAPRWPLSEAWPLRQDTKLACVVAVVSLCYQSHIRRVIQGSFSLLSSSLGESCELGRLVEDAKEKRMWEDRGWAHHGGWDGRNMIIQNRGRNEPLGKVRTLKGWQAMAIWYLHLFFFFFSVPEWQQFVSGRLCTVCPPWAHMQEMDLILS